MKEVLILKSIESLVYVTPSGCWIWISSMNPDGYGRVCRKDSKESYAHRYTWEKAYGHIPEHFEIDHKECKDTRCVRPSHLA